MALIDMPNARDLGGLACDGGGTVRHGLVFRGAAPAGTTAAGAVAALQIQHVIDLRTALEREQQPTFLPPTARILLADMLADAAYSGAATLGTLATDALRYHEVAGHYTGRDLKPIMLASYRDFAMLPSARRAVSDSLRLLSGATGPVLVHCTAGKDRTGWLVAVILRSIGVSWEDIIQDYLASGPAVMKMFSAYIDRLPGTLDAEDLAPVLGVFPEYLDAARESVEAEFGSFEAYLERGLGIDGATIDALRDRLVQAASHAP